MRKLLRVMAIWSMGTLSLTAYADCFRLEIPGGGEIRCNGVDLPKIDEVLHAALSPNPLGVPTSGALIAEVVTHPDMIVKLVERPTDVRYLPIVNAIIDGRNALMLNGARPMPSKIREKLRGFYSEEFMDGVRWSTNWNLIQNTLQAAQMFANRDTKAITLINTIIFRDASSAENVGNWAHELTHVKQYYDWGVLGFAKRWTDNSSDTGPVERPAYEWQESLVNVLNPSGQVIVPIESGAICRELNPSNARCDLYAAPSGSAATFRIQGEAHATGDGTRSGRMQLLLIADGAVCNSTTTDSGVDHATSLTGDGFQCDVRVTPGEMKSVMLVAPNSRADATYTRATGIRIR